MADTITIQDLINKVHKLIDYEKIYQNKTKKIDINAILSIKDQINVKFFKNIDNKNILHTTFFDSIKQYYNEINLEFYSFLYCIFQSLTPDFEKLNISDKNIQINQYIQDLILDIKNNQIIDTTTFKFTKNIVTSLNNKILSDELIHFISIFFNINIFVIDNTKDYVTFYTINESFNQFKKTIILSKEQNTSMATLKNIIYYNLISYVNDSNEPNNNFKLVMDLINNYSKMLIFNQITQQTEQFVDPTKENNINFKIIKIMVDNDLEILSYNNDKNKLQSNEKAKRKQERKEKKNHDKLKDSTVSDSTSYDMDVTTVNMANDLIIHKKYNFDDLCGKDLKELRQIAKSQHIKLSVVLNTKERVNKNKKELIEELLKIE